MRVNTVPLAIVLIRMLSVYLVVTSIVQSGTVFLAPSVWDEFELQLLLSLLSLYAIPLVSGIVLWISAQKIARWVCKDSNEIALPEEVGIVRAGTVLIGIFWAIKSLSALLAYTPSGIQLRYQWLLVFALSSALVLGSNFVTLVYVKLRTAGLSHNKSFKQPKADGTPDGAP